MFRTLSLSTILLSCASFVPFQFTKLPENECIIKIPSERVTAIADKVNDPDDSSDKPDRFLIAYFFLDDKNRVATGLVKDIADFKRKEKILKGISALITNSKMLTVGGWNCDEIDETEKSTRFDVTFNKLGTFKDRAYLFNLSYIANENGDCFSVYGSKGKECYRIWGKDNFPISLEMNSIH